MFVAVLVLLGAGILSEPWRWLIVVDGCLLVWLGLAALIEPALGWPRALGVSTLAYLAVTAALLAVGTPAPSAMAWPFAAVQAGLACPVAIGCHPA